MSDLLRDIEGSEGLQRAILENSQCRYLRMCARPAGKSSATIQFQAKHGEEWRDMGRGELVVEPKLITYTTPLDDRVRGYYTDLWRRGSVQAAIKDRIDEMIERTLNHKQETTNMIETLATAERVRDLIRRYLHVVNRHDSRQSCERPKYYRLLVDAERALNSVVLSGGEFAEEEEEIEEPKPIKLTRNEGRALHILHTERALLDPLGADAGVLERLHDKGAIDDWYEFTDEGRRAYSAFKAEASKS